MKTRIDQIKVNYQKFTGLELTDHELFSVVHKKALGIAEDYLKAAIGSTEAIPMLKYLEQDLFHSEIASIENRLEDVQDEVIPERHIEEVKFPKKKGLVKKKK